MSARQPAPKRLSRSARRKERLAKMGKRRHRLLLGIGLLTCLVICATGFAMLDRGTTAPPSAAAERDHELHDVLQRLRSGIAQQSIERVVPPSLTAERCERALGAILASPADPLFVPAVLLTQYLNVTSLAPLLRTSLPTPDPAIDAMVVRVLDRLQPLTVGDFDDLLAHDAPLLAGAVLAIEATREPTAVPQLAQMLCGTDADLRAAALAAMPPEPPTSLTDEIAQLLETQAPADAVEGLTALAQCPWTARGGRVLEQWLESDELPCDRALLSLAHLAQPLAQPRRVVAIAKDGGRPVLTRARALWCLERTETKVEDRDLTALWPDPVLDYFAARLLLHKGHSAGPQLLARILRHPEGDDPHVEAARLGARSLCADLTDTGLYADPALWLQWADSQPTPTVALLPPSAVDLGLFAEQHADGAR